MTSTPGDEPILPTSLKTSKPSATDYEQAALDALEARDAARKTSSKKGKTESSTVGEEPPKTRGRPSKGASDSAKKVATAKAEVKPKAAAKAKASSSSSPALPEAATAQEGSGSPLA